VKKRLALRQGAPERQANQIFRCLPGRRCHVSGRVRSSGVPRRPGMRRFWNR
jgi:hypothetical protein